jgi:hypothetical protein
MYVGRGCLKMHRHIRILMSNVRASKFKPDVVEARPLPVNSFRHALIGLLFVTTQ